MPPPSGVPASTILVVDDERVARRVVYRILSEEGYRVFEAANAAEAMDVLEQAHRYVALVILDVVMPHVDGVELGRRILARWPALRLLFMSAHPVEVLAERGLDEPPLIFLHKPFTAEELLVSIEQAMGVQAPHTRQPSSRRRRGRSTGEMEAG